MNRPGGLAGFLEAVRRGILGRAVAAPPRVARAAARGWPALGRLLDGREPLRIVLLNDTGFVGGAGIALRRQAQSFLLGGHAAAVVCWLPNSVGERLRVDGARADGWLGVHALEDAHHSKGLTDDEVAERVAERVLELEPDLVVTGNFHWARWPLELVERLHAASVPTVVYLHDCHWFTGRCVYYGGCEKFAGDGCDHTCPTPDSYPALAPDKIREAWEARRQLFAGPSPVPLGANSRWTLAQARRGLGAHARVELLWLGLDPRLFAPIDKRAARRRLGLPEHGCFVLAGAQHVKEPRKGGPDLLAVLLRLEREGLARPLVFGHQSEELPGVTALGPIYDETLMPAVMSAADVFVSGSTEESFGQTLMEAAACGTPLAAMRAGGVTDIAREGENAALVPVGDAEALYSAVRELLSDEPRRRRMAWAGREIVNREFTLEAQCLRWSRSLAAWASPELRAGPPPQPGRGRTA